MPLEKPRGLDLAALDRVLSKRDTTIRRNDASQAFDQALHDNTRTGDVSETVFHHLVARHGRCPTRAAFTAAVRARFGDQPWFVADMVSYVYDDLIIDDDIRALKRRTERSTNGKAKATKRTAKAPRKVKAGRSAERWRTLNNFVDVYARELPPFARDVWLVLFRDSTEGIARTGQASLMKRLGASESTIRRAIRELVKRGFVDVVKLGQKNCGPSVYRVMLPRKDDEQNGKV